MKAIERSMPIKYKQLLDIPQKIADIKSDLNDWHAVKNELLKIKRATE